MIKDEKDEKDRTPRPRGLAALPPERRKEISSKGGKAAHEKGNAHVFNPETARMAGSRGGSEAWNRGTAHRFTSEEAAAAGAKGGRGKASLDADQAEAAPGEERVNPLG